MVDNACQETDVYARVAGRGLLAPLMSMNAKQQAKMATTAVTFVETSLVLMNVSVLMDLNCHMMDEHARDVLTFVCRCVRTMLAVLKVVVFVLLVGKALLAQKTWMNVCFNNILASNCASIQEEAMNANAGQATLSVLVDPEIVYVIHKDVYRGVKTEARVMQVTAVVLLAGPAGHAKQISMNAAETEKLQQRIDDAIKSASTLWVATRVFVKKVSG